MSMVTATIMTILVVPKTFCEQNYMASRKLLIVNFDGDGNDYDNIGGGRLVLLT